MEANPRQNLASHLHHYFERNVALRPNELAVVDEHISLSYEELNKKANQLAHFLVKQHVCVGDHVAVLLNRTADVIVSMLAILKAGGAIVPADPKYPDELVNYMLQDSEAKYVLSSSDVAEALGRRSNDQVLCLDILSEQLSGFADHDNIQLSRPLDGNELVYLVYTSGSTGKPKGVKLPHKSIVNVLADQSRDFDILAQPLKSLHYASISFDVAFHEIITCLYTGGCLYVVNEEIRTDFAALIRYICVNQIERIFMPNPVLQALATDAIQSPEINDLAIKVIVQSGEKLRMSPELVKFLTVTNSQLVNQYGPAEAHVVCYYINDAPYDQWPEYPPVGSHIIKNTQLYVLDENLNQVDKNEVGELDISGVGLAEGYQNKREKTQSQFVENPFSSEAMYQRVYKTGDLVKLNDEGIIEYVGRSDHQVKVRGFRIELAAIESVLLAFEGVKGAVVSAVKLHEGQPDKSLVAHVAIKGLSNWSTEQQSEQLQAFKTKIGDNLPEFMMPSVFLLLDNLPLSNNGKVNRKALQMPTITDLIKSNYQPSSSSSEQALIQIFETVLGIEGVGIGLSFLELGGSSLNAMRLNKKLVEHFGCKVNIQKIMTLSVAELAAHIDSQNQ